MATMDGVLAVAVAGSAIVSAMLAAATVAFPQVASGVTAEDAGGRIHAVEPGSVGWQDGIRPGQTVVSLRAADEAGGWRLVTEADGKVMESTVARHERKLRASWPLMVGSVGAAVASTALFRRQRREAHMAASVAVVLAAVPMAVTANQAGSVLVLSVAVLVPALWLGRWSRLPRGIRIGLVVGAAGLVLAWLAAAMMLLLPGYAVVDDLRFAATVLLTGMVLATALFEARIGSGAWLRDPQASAAISLALLIGLVLVLYAVIRVPPVAVAAIALVAVVAFPRLRRLIATGVDRLVLAERRERLTSEVAEAERSRLAREIHDAPLQELSGVIRQLDLTPGVAPQTRALRDVAEQLRSIATSLHPPALDDLGLAAALRFVGGRAHIGSDAIVEVDVVDRGDAEDRPPPEVELAMVRIAQEGLANAVRHSGASTIRLRATVNSDRVDLEIIDDGVGIDGRAVREAQARGSMGLVSMERRAQAIGARFERIAARPRGTRIAVRWPA